MSEVIKETAKRGPKPEQDKVIAEAVGNVEKSVESKLEESATVDASTYTETREVKEDIKDVTEIPTITVSPSAIVYHDEDGM